MQRDDWKFAYTAGDLATAADTKKQHHAERLDWWQAKQKEVIEMVKANGLEVSESLATQYNDPKQFVGSAALRGAQLIVKNDYQQQLNECHQKIGQHSGKVKEYDGWVQVLRANPSERVQLDIDDWLFFFSR